jgi:putative Ca2+/H+ antiporter (TMEM165/GDT1 family)
MRYKRWKSLRKYCAMIAIGAMLGMTACSGISASNGAWWDVCHDPLNMDCTSTVGGEGSSGEGSGMAG